MREPLVAERKVRCFSTGASCRYNLLEILRNREIYIAITGEPAKSATCCSSTGGLHHQLAKNRVSPLFSTDSLLHCLQFKDSDLVKYRAAAAVDDLRIEARRRRRPNNRARADFRSNVKVSLATSPPGRPVRVCLSNRSINPSNLDLR